ncbi:serine/threonine-protein kinase [Myxococcus qinghaiensis]|uniref:serine/threonine-protein kinase n=1 Tax=Myxococcus qinghaiensis TaxID=2906758 RepID=UPI0020A73F3A|nr:serine/threonine-protein kinase [Myxococcus qinghaiensis]MCP3170197.1 protein kinase [Myxococcus qinghaiensis]
MMSASGSVPLVFGRYAVLSRLAVGGMGEIFLARQVGVSGFERAVILKNLLPDLLEQEGSLEMFLDEARVAGRLNHPNVVSVFEVGEWEGTFYIAMEYIEGENLGRLARAAVRAGAALSPAVCAEIIRDAALGLDHAHQAVDVQGAPLDLVHRDISPQNIMVRLDGVTKVVDFGVAKASNRSTRTRTGILKGKLRYMSPEQVRNQPLDGRSDQYALGVVLWELVTHRPLVETDNPAEAMRRVALTPALKPSMLVDGVSPLLDNIILRMLAKPREQRFERCADVARALQQYLDESPRKPEDGVSATTERLVGEVVRARLREAPAALGSLVPRAGGPSVTCPRCGQSTSGTSRFCPHCGSALNTPSGPQTRSGLTGMAALASEVSEVTSGHLIDAEAPPTELHVPSATTPTLEAQGLDAAPPDATVRMRGREAGALRRKLVIVTVEVEGAEALRRALGPEEGMEVVGQMLDLAASIAERHEAEVVQLTESRWSLAFGLPVSRRDDPLRAVRCVLELLRAVETLGLSPAPVSRAGLEFDAVLVSGGGGRVPWRVTGAGLERSAALAQAASPGEVLAGAAAKALLEEGVRFGAERTLSSGAAWRVEALGGVVRGVPFVGRSEALAAARAVVDSVRAGQGGARLFAGAAGVGKSRLLEAVAESASHVASLRVVRTSAEDLRGAGPMGLMRSVLTGLARALGLVSEGAPLQSLGVLGLSAQEVAALWRRLSHGGPSGQLQAGDAAVTETLLRAARPGGVLLLVDDVHHADVASLELLVSLLSAPGSRVGLVATTVPDVLPVALASLPLSVLEGMPRPELRALLGAAFGALPGAEVEKLVVERAQGNPSFALELMRALVERGAVQRLGGSWQATAPLGEATLPDSLGLALGARLDLLPPQLQRFLSRAAVEGSVFSSALVRASLSTEDAVEDVAELLVADGWLAEVAERPGCLRFMQELSRQVLLERLPASALRRSHQELAEALGQDAFAAEPAREVRVADHLVAAASPNAAAACERAGERLSARGEWRAASEYFRRAMGDALGATPAARLWQLGMLTRACTCLTQVDPTAVEPLAAPWLEKLPDAESLAARAEVVRRVAAADLKLGRVAAAEARLLAIRTAAAADPEVLAWVLGEQARAREARGDVAGAVELLTQSFQRMGGRPARASDFYWEHLNLLGRLQLRLQQPEKARTSFTHASEQARATGHVVGQARALSNLAGLRVLSGEHAAALVELERALVLAEQGGDAQEAARIHYNVGRLLGAGGRVTEARERLERARERARLAGWREGEALATQALGALGATVPRM